MDYLIAMDYQPLNANIQDIQRDKYSKHAIQIYQDPISAYVIGNLLLFNKINIKVILSRSYPIVGIPMCGSEFDIKTKKVLHTTLA